MKDFHGNLLKVGQAVQAMHYTLLYPGIVTKVNFKSVDIKFYFNRYAQTSRKRFTEGTTIIASPEQIKMMAEKYPAFKTDFEKVQKILDSRENE
jgi:hypothetical protein